MAKPTFDEADHPFETKVRWTKTDDEEFPYTATVDGKTWTIRVNDWPDVQIIHSRTGTQGSVAFRHATKHFVIS